MRRTVWLGLPIVIAASLGTVSRASAAKEVALMNPGFESDGTGVASPKGWTSEGSINADFTEFGEGTYRLSHWSDTNYAVTTRQTVGQLKRGHYTLSARVKRSPGDNESYIALDCGGREQRTYLPVAPADSWLTIVVSAEARRDACTIILRTRASGGEWTNFDDIRLYSGEASLSIRGADVSSLTKSVDLGGVYHDDETHSCRDGNSGYHHAYGRSRRNERYDALKILADHGLTHIRLRVWVDPADGYHDVSELLETAKDAKRVGLKTFVDLHYSDSWADPGQQNKPAAWANYSIAELRKAVYAHTYEVAKGLARQGTPADLIQLGNELNSGMLWPEGHTWDPPNWDNLAEFLKAGANAVKAASPKTRIVLHLANGGDNSLYRWWFGEITARNVPFDVIGASYYSYWHGTLSSLQWNLNDISQAFDKDVLVVETGYPFTTGWVDDTNNLIGDAEPVSGYPATPEGQARNVRDVASIVRAVPNGRGLGFFYWEATWTAVPGNGWDPSDPASGNAWENQALFDFEARALPALDEFHP